MQEVCDPVEAGTFLDECAKQWRSLHHAEAPNLLPLQEPALQEAPTHLHYFFHITLSRKFSSHIPLRPLPLPEAALVWEWWNHILRTQMPLLLRFLASSNVMTWNVRPGSTNTDLLGLHVWAVPIA